MKRILLSLTLITVCLNASAFEAAARISELGCFVETNCPEDTLTSWDKTIIQAGESAQTQLNTSCEAFQKKDGYDPEMVAPYLTIIIRLLAEKSEQKSCLSPNAES